MKASKNLILDAAERVVIRDGGAHLTLDAVAAEATMSKGGLLYHYRTKDDLIRAMIIRLQDEFDAELKRQAAEDPAPEGRYTRAYVNATLARDSSPFSIRLGQISAALLAAVATNPSLLEPLREKDRLVCASLTSDGIDPVMATIARLAADGLWVLRLFGVPPLEPGLYDQVVARLNEFTKPL
jgi:AcrR family transcriptional regulator